MNLQVVGDRIQIWTCERNGQGLLYYPEGVESGSVCFRAGRVTVALLRTPSCLFLRCVRHSLFELCAKTDDNNASFIAPYMSRIKALLEGNDWPFLGTETSTASRGD